MKEPIPTESQEQQALFQWVAIAERQHPELRLLYAVPNGGYRNKVTAATLKSEGVKSGVPDMCLPVARGPYHGLYIELKRRKGGKISDTQTEWIQALRAHKYSAVVCYGWTEARQEIERYLAMPERSTMMTDIETDLMLAGAEIATLKAELAAQTARADKAEQERDRAIEDLLKEIIKLACESVEREKTLARLEAEVIAAWNRRAEPENARQRALQAGICPMCEDCPDGCPIETPKDSRNIVTNADRIRGMSDEELAEFLGDEPPYLSTYDKYLDWLRQPAKEEHNETDRR